MRLTTILLTATLALLTACGGGGDSTNTPTPIVPPVQKTYGTFRALKSKSAGLALRGAKAFVAAGAVTTTMQTPRHNHRAILMMNGKVLVIGGQQAAASTSMDVFDPATETFTPSGATLSLPRMNRVGWDYSSMRSFGVTNLPDGKVAIVGGNNPSDGGPGGNIDIYDPATDTINTLHGDLSFYGVEDTYYVGNNKLLVFGGSGGFFIQDMAHGYLGGDGITYYPAGPIPSYPTGYVPAVFSASVQDATGNVWFFGGQHFSTNAILSVVWKYDIATQTLTKQGDLNVARSRTTAVLLPNNKVGIYGGNSVPTDSNQGLKSVEIYDLTTGTSTTSDPLVGTRYYGEAVFLQTGYTLYAGGVDAGVPVASELAHKWDANPVFSGSTGSMTVERMSHSVTSLPNGFVLITGGSTAMSLEDNTAEIYDPGAKLYVSFVTETVVINTTMQMATTYAAGVNWSVTGDNCSIDSTGLLTVGNTTATVISVTATAKDDPTVTAVIQLKIIQP